MLMLKQETVVRWGFIAVVISLAFFSFYRSQTKGSSNRPDGYNISSSEQESKEALARMNQLRIDKRIQPVVWDYRANKLAVARSKDMNDNGYTTPTNPKTKECASSMKQRFQFLPEEIVFETSFYYYYPTEGAVRFKGFIPMKEVVDAWINHPASQLSEYFTRDYHLVGAFGCNGSVCVLITSARNFVDQGCL